MNPEQFFSPTILENDYLKLTVLEEKLVTPLAEALHDPNSFFALHRGYNSVDAIQKSIDVRLVAQKKFESLTFVYTDKKSGTICGMSSFLEPGNHFRRVEIGFTWTATPFQRSYVNTQAKMLMLAHAFKNMGVCRVEFSVDPLNEKSNLAMQRLGAKLDGRMRNWRHNSPLDPGDRNIYSILDSEFPLIAKKFS